MSIYTSLYQKLINIQLVIFNEKSLINSQHDNISDPPTPTKQTGELVLIKPSSKRQTNNSYSCCEDYRQVASNMTNKNILIFGATGLIGRHITNAILTNKHHFGTIAIFTSRNTLTDKPDHISHLQHQGVKILSGDITSDTDITAAYNSHDVDGGFDTIVSALGRPVIDTQEKLIKLAAAHPTVKYFFPSEFGTDVEYDETSAHEIPHQRKLRVRALLREITSTSTSTSITGNNDDCNNHLEYTYIVTGPYADADRSLYLSAQPPEKEVWGTFDVHRKRAVLLGDGNGKISLTTMRDVGKFVVAALLQQQQQQQYSDGNGNGGNGGNGVTKNRALRVNSFTTTPHELLSEFERQTGGEKWQVGYTSVEELERLERENPVVTLRRIWTSGKTLYAERDNDELLHGAKEDNDDDGFFCLDNVESAVAQAIDVQRKLITAGNLYD